MSDSAIDFRPIMEAMRRRHYGNRPETYGDERTCYNCSLHIACWQNGGFDVNVPENFDLRNGWDEGRFLNHMKSVIGQVCSRFSPRNAEARARFERRQAREREEIRQETGWDPEENA